MTPGTRKRRPRQETPLTFADGSLSLVDPLDDVAAQVAGTFVVVVETSAGRYRRRCYLTAAAAELASRRAEEAGHTSRVYLAELRPLWRLQDTPRAAS